MSYLTDYICKLAEEFEEAIPPTIRSNDLGMKPTSDRPVSIDILPTSNFDETELAYLKTALVFDEMSQTSTTAAQLLKSKNWNGIYNVENGILVLLRKLALQFKNAKKMVINLP